MKRILSNHWLAIPAALGLLATVMVTPAAAEDYVTAEGRADIKAERRSGPFIGVGIGVGDIRCEGPGCEGLTESGSLNLHVGQFINPRVALVVDGWLMAHREGLDIMDADIGDFTLLNGMATAGVQLWLLPRVWVRGGVGVARADYRYEGDIVGIEAQPRSDWALGVSAATGVELIQTEHFGLDVQLRGGTGFYEEGTQSHNLALGIGLSVF